MAYRTIRAEGHTPDYSAQVSSTMNLDGLPDPISDAQVRDIVTTVFGMDIVNDYLTSYLPGEEVITIANVGVNDLTHEISYPS